MQLIQLNQNDDPGKDNRALSRMIGRSIHLRTKEAKERDAHNYVADDLFLSPFVLISQNRLGEETERHAELE